MSTHSRYGKYPQHCTTSTGATSACSLQVGTLISALPLLEPPRVHSLQVGTRNPASTGATRALQVGEPAIPASTGATSASGHSR
jgi:hypothetical protein